VNGTELVFKRPGEGSDDDDGPMPASTTEDGHDGLHLELSSLISVVSEEARIVIRDD
jgi:hypothetical protein